MSSSRLLSPAPASGCSSTSSSFHVIRVSSCDPLILTSFTGEPFFDFASYPFFLQDIAPRHPYPSISSVSLSTILNGLFFRYSVERSILVRTCFCNRVSCPASEPATTQDVANACELLYSLGKDTLYFLEMLIDDIRKKFHLFNEMMGISIEEGLPDKTEMFDIIGMALGKYENQSQKGKTTKFGDAKRTYEKITQYLY